MPPKTKAVRLSRSVELNKEKKGDKKWERGGATVNKCAGHNELNTPEQDKDRQMETAGVSCVCVCV